MDEQRTAESQRLRAEQRTVPNAAADAAADDVSLHDVMPQPDTLQGSGATGLPETDDERGDADDAKVTGQSRG